jgi:hypothetical protein
MAAVLSLETYTHVNSPLDCGRLRPCCHATCQTAPTCQSARRFNRPTYARMHVEIDVDDRKASTRPWTVSAELAIVADTEMLDSQCLENEKDVPHLLQAK